jgi:hypothetical protein
MVIDHLLDVLRREWPVIKQAPLLFFSALALLSCAIGGCVYVFLKANLDSKDDLIKTLQGQLVSRPAPEPRGVVSNAKEPPDFRILLMGGNVFVPDKEPGLTGIVLDAVITNTGSPSVAMDWQLSVIPLTGSPRQAQLTKMPASLVARGAFNTGHINAAESLDESTLSDPLQTDVPRSGKLLFYVTLPKQDVMASVLELSVKDVRGRPFMVRQDMKQWLSR